MAVSQWLLTVITGFLTAKKLCYNSHHDRQYLDETATFTNFNSLTTFSKAIFAIF